MSGFYQIIVSGNAEYEEPYCYGSYERKADYLFEGSTFLKAIRKLATVHRKRSHIDFMDCEPSEDNGPLVRFTPNYFTVYNDKKNSIAIGEFKSDSLKFIRKERDPKAIARLKEEILLLKERASYERWCDNFFSARGIEDKVTLLELRFLD